MIHPALFGAMRRFSCGRASLSTAMHTVRSIGEDFAYSVFKEQKKAYTLKRKHYSRSISSISKYRS